MVLEDRDLIVLAELLLDLGQHRRVPLVETRNAIKLKHSVAELLLVAGLAGIDQLLRRMDDDEDESGRKNMRSGILSYGKQRCVGVWVLTQTKYINAKHRQIYCSRRGTEKWRKRD